MSANDLTWSSVSGSDSKIHHSFIGLCFCGGVVVQRGGGPSLRLGASVLSAKAYSWHNPDISEESGHCYITNPGEEIHQQQDWNHWLLDFSPHLCHDSASEVSRTSQKDMYWDSHGRRNKCCSISLFHFKNVILVLFIVQLLQTEVQTHTHTHAYVLLCRLETDRGLKWWYSHSVAAFLTHV